MYEVELKVEADHAAVEARLAECDARSLGAVTQVDTYYGAPHRDFTATDEALRIRRETADDGEKVARVTYKGPLVEAASKTREERETSVGDADAMAAILDAVGFTPVATVRKERARYELDGYTVTLDRVEGVGEFVEVETEVGDGNAETGVRDGDVETEAERGDNETEAEDGDIEPAREGAANVLRSLGLDPGRQIRTSYLELLLESRDEPP